MVTYYDRDGVTRVIDTHDGGTVKVLFDRKAGTVVKGWAERVRHACGFKTVDETTGRVVHK